jgi:hypothetical protein
MSKKINNMQDVYQACGGVMRIAADLGVHSRTIERWREVGIAEKYHAVLAEKYGLFPIELYKLSQKIRNARR